MLADLTITQLRKIIRQYNIHTVIKGYTKSNVSKDDLINLIHSKMTYTNGQLVINPNLDNVNIPEQFQKKPKQKEQKMKTYENKNDGEIENTDKKYKNKLLSMVKYWDNNMDYWKTEKDKVFLLSILKTFPEIKTEIKSDFLKSYIQKYRNKIVRGAGL